MEKIFVIVLLFISVQTFGQLTEDFSDGDFTNNPVWSADNPANWTVLNGALRSNSPTLNSSFYITTPSVKATQAQWEFLVNLQFNTSNANFVDVYLTSQLANLGSASNSGYFVRIGGTADEISFYKMSSGVATMLINGTDGITNTSNNLIRIKVIRNAANQWTLERDATGGTSYLLEGTITDNSFSTSGFFGVRVQQSTASFINKHFFDDIYVGNIITDAAAPVLQSTQVITSTELELVFNEALDKTTAETLANFTVNNEIGKPESAVLQADKKTVKLVFTKPFVNGIQNQITISGVKDLAGNEMTTTSLSFLYFVPQPALFNDLVITELFPDPSPQVGLPAQEFVEILNQSTKAFDLNGWKLSDPGTVATLPSVILLPGEYIIITNSAAVSNYTPFGKVIGLANFPTLNNNSDNIKLADPANLKIDSVHYDLTWYQDDDKAQGGWTLERLNPQINTNEASNWQSSEYVSGGTPGKKNSVFGKNPDSKPPQLSTLTVVNQNDLLLEFSEALLKSNAQETSRYTIDETKTHPSLITLSADLKSVQLHFDASFVNGVSYTLTISGLKDMAENSASDIQKIFLYFNPVSAKTKDILITEIMADPTPVVQLPEAEFIEIYNASSTPFDLGGWKLNDANSSATLPSSIILPNDYLIVTSTANVSKLGAFGKTLGVAGFPSLNNSGEPVAIKDANGLTIDSVNYKLSWYQDKVKQDGGWSLERLLSSFSTTDSSNWRASEDMSGGTPGRQNSWYGKNPDSKAPTLLSVRVSDDKNLVLNFSEPLQSASAVDVLHYEVKGIGHPSASILSDDGKSVRLSFLSPFANGIDLMLIVSGIRDEAGNLMPDADKSFRYFLAVAAKTKDILITEIMADPTPVVQLPEAEFIEIYNASSTPFDLGGWKLNDATGSATLPSAIILPNDYLIVTSTANVSKLGVFGKTLGVAGFPSLNNSGEPVAIKDANGLTIDSVNYKLSWYQDKVKQDGGWSLERLLSSFSTTDSSNWRASEDMSGGTPGRQNSWYGKNPDSKPPTLLNVQVLDEKNLVLNFSEPLQSASAVDVLHYEVKGLGHPSTSVLSDDGKSVRLSFLSPFANGIDLMLIVSGIRDVAGNLMPDAEKSFRYFLAVAAKTKDILITEIMADPSPVVQLPEAEFIEIYNASSTPFDLAGWKLNDATGSATLPSSIILPNDYLIVTSTANVSKLGVFGKTLGVPGFPSLNNPGEPLSLKSNLGDVIDSVNYSLSWYRGDDKKEGGWSLELIDPLNKCGEEENWICSDDDKGGTPGKQNSVLANKPDVTGPVLLSVATVNDKQIILQFNEKLEKEISLSSFALTPEAKIIKVSFTDRSLRQLSIDVQPNLLPRTLYRIDIQNLRDCSGNSIPIGSANMQFALPERADSLDLSISEVLFNPPPGGVDFLEIYNNSPKYINLRNWMLANYENGKIKNEESVTKDNLVMAPGAYVVFTSDVSVLKRIYPLAPEKNFFQMDDLPSLPDDEGNIVLVRNDGKIIDHLSYSQSQHSPLIKNEEGVSLERISFSTATNNPSNWKSANASVGYATPGYINSNTRPDDQVTADQISIQPEIFSNDPQKAEFTQIYYRFEQSGRVANVKIFDLEGRLVKEICNNDVLGYEGFFRWDGDTTEGYKARSGYYSMWMQVFDPDGKTQTYRKRIVLTSR